MPPWMIGYWMPNSSVMRVFMACLGSSPRSSHSPRCGPGELLDRLVADLPLPDLARRRTWQRLRRAQDVAGQLVAREVPGQELAEGGFVEPVAGVDRRADLLAHAVVRHRVHRGF